MKRNFNGCEAINTFDSFIERCGKVYEFYIQYIQEERFDCCVSCLPL